MPGYEAPVKLAYSARNRSAAVRVPYVASPKGKRIEVRFPDSMGNPYLTFTAMLMAGLDGIENKLDPGAPLDKNLYDLPPREQKRVPEVCGSLTEALESLDKDRAFLKKGGVMNDDFIDAYIELKREECARLQLHPHPVEFDMYYKCLRSFPDDLRDRQRKPAVLFVAGAAAEPRLWNVAGASAWRTS